LTLSFSKLVYLSLFPANHDFQICQPARLLLGSFARLNFSTVTGLFSGASPGFGVRFLYALQLLRFHFSQCFYFR
jgi:hypothetical protein